MQCRSHPCIHLAYDAICTIRGITRVLTRYVSRCLCTVFLTVAPFRTLSGQSTSVPMGLPVLQMLLQRSQTGDGPVILPGAGVNPGSIRAVLDSLLPYGLKEIHMSGGRWSESEMVYRSEGMGMGASVQREWGIWQTDGNSVREVRSIADSSVQGSVSSA
jgi:copper homeostasis protein CutC